MLHVLLLSCLLCVLYAAVVFLYAQRFLAKGLAGTPWPRTVLVIAILLHLGFLLLLTVRIEGSLLKTSAGGLSALALGLAFAYFLIEWISRERNMGLWLMILPLVFQVLASLAIRPESTPSNLPESPLLAIHIVASLIGYCAFSLSAAFSVMYLMQYRGLKIHRLGLIFERLPALEKLEGMGYRAVLFGLGFLLIGVLLGEYLLYQDKGRLVLADPKILVALISLAVYGLAILTRKSLSIQGKRFALVSIGGFGLILLSLLVVDFLPGFHQF